jgi:membrane dipeptidase
VGDSLPAGMKDVADYPNLIEELLKLGYSEIDIQAILGGNLMRVWRQAEQFAARQQRSR